MKFYFDKLKFELFIKYVESFKDTDLILDYAANNKLSSDQLYVLSVLICKSSETTDILEFATKYISDRNCLSMLGNAIYKSDNLYCMHAFATLFPGIAINNDIVTKMCKLGDTSHILPYLNSEFISFSVKRLIVSTIIEKGTNEQLNSLVSNYYILLMDTEREAVKNKVCESGNGILISNVASEFKDQDKQDFIDAICLIESIQHKYLFLKQNLDITSIQKLSVVSEICNSDDVEYIYETLLLFKDGPNNVKKLLLDRLRKIGNPKYLMLTAIYLDEEYLINNFDRLEQLYSSSVLSDDINEVFTNDELMGMYKHMQMVKAKKNNK